MMCQPLLAAAPRDRLATLLPRGAGV